jgi:hypothetical protein
VKKPKHHAMGAVERCLVTEKFYGLAGELAKWRTNPDIVLADKNKSKGRVLGFVKGLRFSARVAYLVRDILAGTDLHVSWGHLVDKNGASCSPECDIIVHPPGCIHKWNCGGKHPIMDFKFIKSTDARAIISCKSLARSIDTNYSKVMKAYNISCVYLVAECCDPKALPRLAGQAKRAGYSGFCSLYTMQKRTAVFSVNEPGILEFVMAMRDLATKPRKRV